MRRVRHRGSAFNEVFQIVKRDFTESIPCLHLILKNILKICVFADSYERSFTKIELIKKKMTDEQAQNLDISAQKEKLFLIQ